MNHCEREEIPPLLELLMILAMMYIMRIPVWVWAIIGLLFLAAVAVKLLFAVGALAFTGILLVLGQVFYLTRKRGS